jgi:cysteine desulfuration protein SufE
MTQSIAEIQDEVVEEFAMLTDWVDKYEHLIDLGNSLPVINDAHKIDENLIKGCQSRVWLHAELQNGTVHYSADSDALITKGIVALILRVFNDYPAEEIAKASLDFVDRIGLKEHLSPTRSNGLVSMLRQIKFYAIALQAKTA